MTRVFKKLPSLKRLRELFEYDAETGVLSWRVSRGTRRAGSEAGWLSKNGYVYVGLDNGCVAVHRIVWYMHYGKQPKQFLDHIDRDPTNNRIANLRECTHAQNQQNKKTYSNNVSGAKGVNWYPRYNKWRVRIQHLGRPILVGMFNTFEDACAARLSAQQKLHTHANNF